MPQGTLFLAVVSAARAGGCGHITLKGHRLLREADPVVASAGLRAQYATEPAGRGVMDGGHGLFTELALRWSSEAEVRTQEATVRERLEAAHAAGRTIVLLDSGDIALFGPYRGYLAAFAHLRPVLVPGVELQRRQRARRPAHPP